VLQEEDFSVVLWKPSELVSKKFVVSS